METNNSEIPVWRTKEGEIPISSMTDNHLQRAYNTAEYRYMKYMNLSESSSQKAAMLEKLLRQLEKEAYNRKYQLIPLSMRDKKTMDIRDESEMEAAVAK